MARWRSLEEFAIAVGTVVTIAGVAEGRGETAPTIITLHEGRGKTAPTTFALQVRGERGQSVLLRVSVVEILEERPQPPPPPGPPPERLLREARARRRARAQGGPP